MRTAAPAAARPLPSLLLLLASFAVVASAPSACKDGQDPIASSAASEDEAADPAAGIILQTRQSERSPEGAACDSDEACMEPLRCLEGAICAVPPGVDGTGALDTAPRILLDVDRERPVRVYLEVADSFYERKRGLMWRTRMAPDWGMLFVFPDEDTRSFWMSNTYLALDMIFIDRDGRIVSISEGARPLNTEPRYTSAGPARYVLEVNAGFAHEHSLAAGQHVRLVDVEGDHEPAILP